MSTDPRRVGGNISGPDDPYGVRTVNVDLTNAVLLDHTVVSTVEPYRDGQPQPLAFALQLEGRINRTDERVSGLYLMDADGVAALVTELHGVASRSGWDLSNEVIRRLAARWRVMPK